MAAKSLEWPEFPVSLSFAAFALSFAAFSFEASSSRVWFFMRSAFSFSSTAGSGCASRFDRAYSRNTKQAQHKSSADDGELLVITADYSATAQRTHEQLRHRRSEADLPATFSNAAVLAKQERSRQNAHDKALEGL